MILLFQMGFDFYRKGYQDLLESLICSNNLFPFWTVQKGYRTYAQSKMNKDWAEIFITAS